MLVQCRFSLVEGRRRKKENEFSFCEFIDLRIVDMASVLAVTAEWSTGMANRINGI